MFIDMTNILTNYWLIHYKMLWKIKLNVIPILERKFEVKGKLKNENLKKVEITGNNLVIIWSSDFYNILFISLLNYLSRNITKLIIDLNLL